MRYLKEKETQQLSRKLNRYIEKLDIMGSSFLSDTNGPYNKNITLEEVSDLIINLKKQINGVVISGSCLNMRQQIFKQPITHFKTLW